MIKISITFDNSATINKYHVAKVQEVIDNSTLKRVSSNWKIEYSDMFKNMVYIIDLKKKQKYAIEFIEDTKGYDYIILKGAPKLRRIEPAILNKPANRLTTKNAFEFQVEQELFEKGRIDKIKNLFEVFLKNNKLKFDKETYYTILLKENSNYCVVQVLPLSKEINIYENLTKEKQEEKIKEIEKDPFFFLFGQKQQTLNVELKDTNEFKKDIRKMYKGFEVKQYLDI